jgi:hypothetical protein
MASSSSSPPSNPDDNEIDLSEIRKVAKDVVIFQWESRWGLPSHDPFCLTAQLLLGLAGVGFNVDNCNNPDVSPEGMF